MESDPNEPLPFAVGEVIQRKESKIVVHWFGQARQNASMLGIWKKGYVDTGDNRRYYHDRKLHKNHLLYTSTLSESKLDIEDILCQPFLLTNRNKIPPSILRAISRDETVDWNLPSECINALFVQTTQQ